MNDLPLDEVPPNVVHLQCMQGGEPFPAEELESDADNLKFQLNPFTDTFTSKVQVSCHHANFGMTVGHDEINGCGFVKAGFQWRKHLQDLGEQEDHQQQDLPCLHCAHQWEGGL
jgi:hypothetical protein